MTQGAAPDGPEGQGGPDGAQTGDAVVVPQHGVRTIVLVRWGLLGWLIVLAVLLFLPEMRTGERSWWPWVPVAGLVLGALGHVYLARGKGNAAEA